MHWIALRWLPEAGTTDTPEALAAMPTPESLGWWALKYTPHVAWLDEALMLEVSACERLWGGRMTLMRLLLADNPVPDARMPISIVVRPKPRFLIDIGTRSVIEGFGSIA